MGHSSITMTFDVYGHLFEDANDVAADAIEQSLRLMG
jgi:integrase